MNYFKKAWRLSGSLPKKSYFTICNIGWTAISIFLIISQLSVFGNLPSYVATFGLLGTIRDLLECILIILLEIIWWYVNARFSPFINKAVLGKNKHGVKRAINRGKQIYSETMNNGPTTTYEKKNPFGGDAKYTAKVNSNIFGDTVVKGKVESNWQEKTESNAELKYRSATDGLVMGLASLLRDYIAVPVVLFLVWGINFVIGWFYIKPFVKADDQAKKRNDLLRGK